MGVASGVAKGSRERELRMGVARGVVKWSRERES